MRAKASIFQDAELPRLRLHASPLRPRGRFALWWEWQQLRDDCRRRAALRVRGSLLDRQRQAECRPRRRGACWDREVRARPETFEGIFWFAARFDRTAAIFER